MPSYPLQTPSGAKQRRDKSRKRATEPKRESHKRVNSTTRKVKIEADQNLEAEPVRNPTRGIFSRFMRQEDGEHSQNMRVAPKNDSEHIDQGATTSGIEKPAAQQRVYSDTAGAIQSTSLLAYRNKSGVVKYPKESEAVVKVEGAPLNETREAQDTAPPEADNFNRDKMLGHIKQQDSNDITVSSSSIERSTEDSERRREDVDSTRQLPNREEESGATSEKSFQDGASENAVGETPCDEMEDIVQSTISADAIDTTEKPHKKNRKKRKHKRSRKRSRSRERSNSSKRRKSSESFTPDHEREHAESSGDEEQSANEFDAERARARIPTGCSVRHEHDQKREIKEGKKIVKSKKFTKMMLSTLKDHQLTVLSWMVNREKELARPAPGGIIGDEMGLGKTVTSLACIAANWPPKKDRKKFAQATLVVVPNRKVATQWLSEAKKHWHEEASSRVTIYNSSDDRGPMQYGSQWIVLATYGQVRNHLPNVQVLDLLNHQYADDRETFDREFNKLAKDLLRIKWFRVILDEGHGITKWNGRTLYACTRIQAQHRWVLSGTPILNKPIGEDKNAAKSIGTEYHRADEILLEFYSYATFICCEFRGKRRVFRNEYIVQEATNEAFDTLASYLMYRRTAEKLDIPPTTHREVYVEISQEEEIICNAINAFYKNHELKQQKEKEDAEMPTFEDEQDEDEVEDIKPEEEDSDSKKKEPRTRSIQASRQLRLRQALSHPYCLENFLTGKYFSDDEFKSLASGLKSISEEKKTVIEQLEVDEDWGKNLGLYQTGIDELKSRRELFMGGNFDMNEIMDLVLLQRTVNVQKCGGTVCDSQDLSRFKCGHMYCGKCLGRLMTERSNLSEAERTGYIRCSMDGCGQELLFAQSVFTLEMLAASAAKDKNYVEIGRDSIKTTVQARLERSLLFVASSLGPQIVPPPSSRLTATMAVAMTWLKEAPQDKIIIFTQFIATLKMLGYLFETLGVKFVYYSGALSKQKQEHAMGAFQNDPETMVMISTLKSGGQSHNLTVANRVIIVDLWWNKTAEKQAISRVARMGQTKETYSVRIVTKHSMDDHVIGVQTVKEETIARMLQDDGHVCTEVDDERLEKIFEPKEGDQVKSQKRRVKEEPSEERADATIA